MKRKVWNPRGGRKEGLEDDGRLEANMTTQDMAGSLIFYKTEIDSTTRTKNNSYRSDIIVITSIGNGDVLIGER